jgi:phage terminase large subunit-like protein
MAERAIGKYERLALERHERDLALSKQPGGHPRGLYFDEAAADHAVQFIERYCKHWKGEWAGAPITLEDWQSLNIIRVIFGWRRRDGTRRFRKAWIELARKNGKTVIAAAIALYLLVADGEMGAEVYSTATKEDQAKRAWSDAAAMVKQSPGLKRFIKEHRSKGGTLYCDKTSSFFRPLGADSKTLDGLNVHGDIRDEVHAWKDHGLATVMDSARGARRQPLTVEITTAGTFDQEGLGWQHHEYATKVLEGVFEDDSQFVYIAAIDEDDDPWDPAVWGKANPNLGISVKPDNLTEEAEYAKRQPSEQNDFICKRLNRWTAQAKRWLSVEKWTESDPVPKETALEVSREREKALAGKACCAGLDGAHKVDLAALVMAFLLPGNIVELVPRFWLPDGMVKAQIKKGRRHYQTWQEQGWLKVTPGDVIDHDFIRAEIVELGKQFQIQEIAFDPFGLTQLATQLGEQDGFQMVDFRQGYLSMSEPSKDLEARIVAKQIRHGGNPILRWMIGNAVAKKDAAGNIKPDKEKATDKIDGVVASIMALGRANLNGGRSGSYLETQEALVL